MKIAFLKSTILKRGGLEKYTLQLARRFAQSGYDVTLLTTDWEEGALGAIDFKVVSLGNKTSFSLLQLIRFDHACKQYVEKNKQDMVFGLERNFCHQNYYRAGNGCHAAYLERRRKTDSWLKCASFCINPLHQLILSMEKSTFESRELKQLFVNSHMVKQEIQTYYPKVDPNKVSVVHNGVEWHELQKPFEEGIALRPKIMQSLGLNPDLYQFLFVGNEYGRKGLMHLLDALATFAKKNFELTIIGKERNPKAFIEKAKELGLQPHVHFVGQATDMKPYYSAADALVIPSLYDPFANVTVEALAMGLHVISSSSNGGSEVITQAQQGSVYNDPSSLSFHLKNIMSCPKTLSSATSIRNSVAYLDFSNQIGQIINACR